MVAKLGGGSANSRELGRFLRAHRDARQPADVGLRDTGKRRTPGLRREEVSALSGVGLAWYTWLEQGKVIPSRPVLASVCATLGLTDASVQHVMALAGWQESNAQTLTLEPDLVAWGRSFVESWSSNPAVLLDGRYDMIAWNDAFRVVWCDPENIGVERRNLMWATLGEPSLVEGMADHGTVARAILASFRAQTARHADDERIAEIYEILQADFPSRVSWWHCQGIDRLTRRDVQVETSDGPLTLVMSALRPVEAPEATIVVWNPVEDNTRQLIGKLMHRFMCPTSLVG